MTFGPPPAGGYTPGMAPKPPESSVGCLGPAFGSLFLLLACMGLNGCLLDTGDADNGRWGWALMGIAVTIWSAVFIGAWRNRPPDPPPAG